ncbi:MAG: type I-B CRISPR-associated protein Cas5b [Methanosarcina vacuolata]|jgi:CRISPR-associated protein Cas5h|nr:MULTISPECIES: type I-B CRISPR-associated protein Cas5b [Methanosarcina]MCC4767138.1 type I-B CRISPR-associated protein Cas5 [Methanosarcina sp. DH1]MDY0128967.1 type I-B CRISPR-associated protein Cas5b [Methanosarcina vacuolata]
MKVLVFDVWGEFGHFRKHYTTTSPLTYSIPPRTAIAGMIGAIEGFGKDEYLQYFSKEKANIAVKISHPIKKTRISENLIDTKIAPMMSRIKTRTQIRFEVLKDVKYRIYFSHSSEEVYNKLYSMLKEHKSVYTLCLGLSEHIANYEFIGEMEAVSELSDSEREIHSVIPEKELIKISFEEGKEYFSETIPIEMLPNREVTEYGKILFEKNAKCILANVSNLWRLENGEGIVFM